MAAPRYSQIALVQDLELDQLTFLITIDRGFLAVNEELYRHYNTVTLDLVYPIR